MFLVEGGKFTKPIFLHNNLVNKCVFFLRVETFVSDYSCTKRVI